MKIYVEHHNMLERYASGVHTELHQARTDEYICCQLNTQQPFYTIHITSLNEIWLQLPIKRKKEKKSIPNYSTLKIIRSVEWGILGLEDARIEHRVIAALALEETLRRRIVGLHRPTRLGKQKANVEHRTMMRKDCSG